MLVQHAFLSHATRNRSVAMNDVLLKLLVKGVSLVAKASRVRIVIRMFFYYWIKGQMIDGLHRLLQVSVMRQVEQAWRAQESRASSAADQGSRRKRWKGKYAAHSPPRCTAWKSPPRTSRRPIWCSTPWAPRAHPFYGTRLRTIRTLKLHMFVAPRAGMVLGVCVQAAMQRQTVASQMSLL